MTRQGMSTVEAESLSYTVHVSRDQAALWAEAAAVQGPTPVESWLVSAADAHLQELVRSGRLASLAWFWDRFWVPVAGSREVQVRGEVSGPFGLFQGDSTGPGEPGCCRHSLVHLPTRRIIATLSLVEDRAVTTRHRVRLSPEDDMGFMGMRRKLSGRELTGKGVPNPKSCGRRYALRGGGYADERQAHQAARRQSIAADPNPCVTPISE